MNDAEWKYLSENRFRALYSTQLSALYHQKRERFFDFLDKIAKAIAIIGGSATLAQLSSPAALIWIALAITVTSALSLVFGLSESARRHAELARSFRLLEAKIASKGERDFTEADLAAWESETRTLESMEPAALGALVVDCQNELAIAGNRRGDVVKVPLWALALKNWCDWNPSTAA